LAMESLQVMAKVCQLAVENKVNLITIVLVMFYS
jgi:hypothetical protein